MTNNKFKNYLLYTVLLLTTIMTLYVFFTKDKTGYVDNSRLYREFKGTKELEDKLTTSLTKDRQLIDSLNKAIIALEKVLKSKNPDVEEIDAYKKLLVYNDSLKYVYQNNLQMINSKISVQSWNVLNEYIIEYGKKNNYKYIFGASGNGNLMYASDKKDITEAIIKYANKKYEGN